RDVVGAVQPAVHRPPPQLVPKPEAFPALGPQPVDPRHHVTEPLGQLPGTGPLEADLQRKQGFRLGRARHGRDGWHPLLHHRPGDVAPLPAPLQVDPQVGRGCPREGGGGRPRPRAALAQLSHDTGTRPWAAFSVRYSAMVRLRTRESRPPSLWTKATLDT